MKEFNLTVNKKKGVDVNLRVVFGEGSTLEEIIADIPSQLDSMAIECATLVAGEVIESEVTKLCGARIEGREHRRGQVFRTDGVDKLRAFQPNMLVDVLV